MFTISENTKSGFIVISFKNGIETIIIVTGVKNRIVAQLPSSFTFDKEKKKVAIEVFGKSLKKTYFDFQSPQSKEYGVKELKETFPVEQWQIQLEEGWTHYRPAFLASDIRA